MKEINTRSFREGLAAHLNELIKNNEPVLVSSPDRKVVIISKAKYDMMINKINGDK